MLFNPDCESVAVIEIVTFPDVQELGFIVCVASGGVVSAPTVKYTVTGTDIFPLSSAAHNCIICCPGEIDVGITKLVLKGTGLPFGL